MKISYDPQVDAAYIYFKKEKGQVTTIRVSEDIAIDLGPKEEIWGIEILSAKKHLGPAVKGHKLQVELENVDMVN